MAIGRGNAKTILFGEHFVVYGCKAIGFGLDRTIEIEAIKSQALEIGFDADENVKKAIKIFQKNLGIKNFRINIKKSGIPAGSGLGSSAALNVAIARAISNEFGIGLTDKKICRLAFEAEKAFHGTPSGIDNTLATFGGSIIFQKIPKGNLIKQLSVGEPLHLVMVDSGIKSGTKFMVDKVCAFKETNPEVFLKILAAEVAIVNLAADAIKNGETAKIGALMDANHGLLNTIGATNIENEKIVTLAREAGALGAKVVGAGGGGFCAALARNEKVAVKIILAIGKEYKCFYNNIPVS